MTPEEFVEAVEHVTRVTLLNIEPGATVLLEVDGMTDEGLHRLSKHASELFAPHKVAILADGVRVSGIRVKDDTDDGARVPIETEHGGAA